MEEALEKIPQRLPDVVLSDIGLPGMSGIDGVRILKNRHPNVLVLKTRCVTTTNGFSTRRARAPVVIF